MEAPKHIAFIMDGNRRFAKREGIATYKGHEAGIQAFLKLVEEGKKISLKAMTFYGFSTENWKRSKDEVSFLMKLFHKYLKDYVDQLQANNIQLRHAGRKDRLPQSLVALLQETEKDTSANDEMILTLCLDYGGRDEIVRSFQNMAQDLSPEQWSEETLEQYLDTAGTPPIDIMVRTSGEHRLSNFLIWQCAYSEYFFEPFYFPEFTPERLHDLISRFHERGRRFGA